MKIQNAKGRKAYDACVLPFFQGKKTPKPAYGQTISKDALKPALSSGDFKAKEGETLVLYPAKGKERLVLLGLGEEKELSDEVLRNAYAAATQLAMKKNGKRLN